MISRKFSGVRFFTRAFDKPIKSLYFRSFVVSVLFARFHFKVIRKSLYSAAFKTTVSFVYLVLTMIIVATSMQDVRDSTQCLLKNNYYGITATLRVV